MDVKKARGKSVDYVTFDGTNGVHISDWISETSQVGKAIWQGERIYVPTLAGTKIGNVGDIIVKDPVGDFNLYTREDFDARFEAVK